MTKFCGKCGSLLPTNINLNNSIPAPPKNRSGKVTLTIVIALIVVVLLVAVIISNGETEQTTP